MDQILVGQKEFGDGIIVRSSQDHAPAPYLRWLYDGKPLWDVALFGVPADEVAGTDALIPIKAHKNVLAFASKHLHELFTREDVDGTVNALAGDVTCPIPNLSHDSLQRIVELIYLGKVELDGNDATENLRQILIGAKQLEMKDLVNACEIFLCGGEQLHLLNCIDIWRFSFKHECVVLFNTATEMAFNSFAIIKNDVKFLDLECKEVSKLLSTDLFKTDADEQCLAALAWLEYDAPTRGRYAVDIMTTISFNPNAVSMSTLHVAGKSHVIRNKLHSKIFDTVANSALNNPSNGKRRRDEQSRRESKFIRCVPNNMPKMGANKDAWYVIGGQDNESQFTVYDVAARCWYDLPSLPWTRTMAGACALGKRLVVMGGKKHGNKSVEIDEYSMLTSTWTTNAAKLDVERCESAVCAYDKYAYVLGSFISPRSVERYCVLGGSSACEQMAEMIEGRIRCAAVCSPGSDAIFVCGGIQLATTAAGGKEVLYHTNSVEMYDCSVNKWSSIGNIDHERSGLAASLVSDDLHISGGFANGSECTNVVEIFNIRTSQLRKAPSLTQRRYGCKGVTLDQNVVCVVGGARVKNQSWSTVEAFDVREGKWTTAAIVPDMPKANTNFGLACV